MPVVLPGRDKPSKRRGDVPCDGPFGCPKGHYKDSPDLKPGEAFLMTLYKANRSSSGAFLNDAERSDSLVMEVFANLSDMDGLLEERRANQSSMQLIEIVSSIRRASDG